VILIDYPCKEWHCRITTVTQKSCKIDQFGIKRKMFNSDNLRFLKKLQLATFEENSQMKIISFMDVYFIPNQTKLLCIY